MGLRVDLEGLRFRKPGEDTVYLIDQGKKRAIPDPNVYAALFRTWDNIHLDIDINAIDDGPPVGTTAILFRCYDGPAVYLLDNNKKRLITSPGVMERFQFDWNRIHVWNVSISQLNYQDGPTISKEGRPD